MASSVYLARTAEAAERYDDMCQFMKELVLWADAQEPKHNLTSDERNLLSVAYKNVIGARRASWRTLTGAKDSQSESGDNQDSLVQLYQTQVEEELKEICLEILVRPFWSSECFFQNFCPFRNYSLNT